MSLGYLVSMVDEESEDQLRLSLAYAETRDEADDLVDAWEEEDRVAVAVRGGTPALVSVIELADLPPAGQMARAVRLNMEARNN